MIARGWGGGMESECLIGGISVWEVDKVLEVDGGDGSTTMSVYLMPLMCTLKNG